MRDLIKKINSIQPLEKEYDYVSITKDIWHPDGGDGGPSLLMLLFQ